MSSERLEGNMKCPSCEKLIDHVNVFKEVHQKGTLIDDTNEIGYYGRADDTEIISVECPECGFDLILDVEL
jgi:Zn ribbon nucleic-acid-binding protein